MGTHEGRGTLCARLGRAALALGAALVAAACGNGADTMSAGAPSDQAASGGESVNEKAIPSRTLARWSAPRALPIVPVSTANLPDGKVLLWAAEDRFTFGSASGRTYTVVYDPVASTIGESLVSETGHDMFCVGTSNLADGRLLVNGGIDAANTSLYDPLTGRWSRAEPMNIPRGYEANATLQDGSVLTLGGSWSGGAGNKHGELWAPGRGWRRLPGVPIDSFLQPSGVWGGDAHMWLIPAGNGKVLHAGPSVNMSWIDTAGDGAVTPIGPRADDQDATTGNTVMYDAGRILKTGGATYIAGDNVSSNSAFLIDVNTGVSVRRVASMSYGRAFHNSVVLPNGQVVVVGGQARAVPFSNDYAVLATELFDPETETFTVIGTQAVPRTYHSVALLLPDGRVMSAGGGLCGAGCAANHADLEILSPPYLFNADGSVAARPAITSAPVRVGYGTTAAMSVSGAVSSFAMVRLSSTTHTVNNDQRRVPLGFRALGGDRYEIDIPTNPGVLLPGNWMLFALGPQGTPSIARTLLVSPQGTPVLANPGDQSATQGVATSVTVRASDPAGRVLRYAASGLPPGLAIDAQTGAIAGTPNAPGRYVVTLSASNGAETASTWFVWTIAAPGTTRFLRLEALSEVNGNPWASLAELTVLDADGRPLSRSGWSARADSAQADAGNGASAAIDGDPKTLWHTQWSPSSTPMPHALVVDLGAPRQVSGVRLLPRQDGNPNGTIAAFRILASADGVRWSAPLAQGNLLELGAWNVEKAVYFNNLALGRPALQSSIGWDGAASRAVDGNVDGQWGGGSVTHTQADAPAWWQVDLGAVQSLHALRLWNRTDCCGERLADVQVFVSATDMSSRTPAQLLADPAVWRATYAGAVGRTALVALGTAGRFVRVQLAGPQYLSLAEAQVWGWPGENHAPVFDAIGQQRAVRGSAFATGVRAVDPDGETLRYAAGGLPAGLAIDAATGTVSGTPSAAGTFRVTVSASDPRGANASISFTLLIEEPPLAIAPIAPPPAASGATVTYTAQANHPGTLAWRWDFGDGTPVVTGTGGTVTHTYARSGSYTVTVSVTDTGGETATLRFTQSVLAGTAAVASRSSGPIALERRAAGDRIWVVNPDNDSVAVIDAASRTRIAEIAVGQAPRALAIAGDGAVWVTNKRSDSVSVVDPSRLAVRATIALPRGALPYGIAFATDGTAYVALEGYAALARYDASGRLLASLTVGGRPRHLAVIGAQRVLLPRYITAPLPGEATARVQTSVDGVPVGGEMLVIGVQAGALSVQKTVTLRHSDKVDTSVQGRGVPNYLGAPAVSLDGRAAWVPSKQDNVQRGVLRDGRPLTFENTVRAISSRVDLDALVEDDAARIDHDNAGLASAAAFHPSGRWLFVALETSREVAVIDAASRAELTRFAAGRAPQGLAFSADGLQLYVSNFMDRTVSAHDLSALVGQGEPRVPPIAAVATVAAERLDPQVLTGKQLFYDARDPRLARDGYLSCASCHNDGGHDGRVWDLTGFGEGLRNTIALRGRGGAHGRLHWSANFDEVQDFEGQIRTLAAGTGLMSDALFNAGTRSQPLGDRKGGLSAELDALAAYVGSLNAFDRSPYRAAGGGLTTQGAAGAAVYARLGCASCHGGEAYTQSVVLPPQSIGTIKPASGKRLGGPLTGIDPPTLRDLWSSGPYLHDGSAPSLVAAVRAHAGVSVSTADLTSLARFLVELDGEQPAPATPAEVPGLLGEYYAALVPGGGAPVLRRNEAIDADWGAGSPAPGLAADRFSVRWSGTLVAPASGTYRLRTISDDGVRVWIDGRLAIDNWTLHAPTADTSAPLALAQGQRAAIRVEFYEYTGGAVARLQWQTPGAADFAPVPASSLRSLPADAPGLVGEYWAGLVPGAGTPLAARVETVDFDWGTGSPGPGIGSDRFAARWSGALVPAASGDYVLQTRSDDGVRVWVDGRLVIDNWTLHAPTDNTSTAVPLVAGRRHAIRMEYYENTGLAVAQLRWRPPGSALFVPVPASALRTITGTP